MKKILLDIVPVLVGILLALSINSLKQDRDETRYLENSLAFTLEENKQNIQELERAIEKQQVLIDSLKKYVDDETKTLSDILYMINGVYTPDLKSTTWTFLIQDSKHTLVPYEFVNKVAEIQKNEKLLFNYNEKVRDVFYQPSFYTDLRMKDVCLILFIDFMNLELEFIKELKSFNEYLKSEFDIESL